jgi:hypothetical protein
MQMPIFKEGNGMRNTLSRKKEIVRASRRVSRLNLRQYEKYKFLAHVDVINGAAFGHSIKLKVVTQSAALGYVSGWRYARFK